jgi:hypothetical protein
MSALLAIGIAMLVCYWLGWNAAIRKAREELMALVREHAESEE